MDSFSQYLPSVFYMSGTDLGAMEMVGNKTAKKKNPASWSFHPSRGYEP